MKHRDEGLRKICGHEELRQLVQEALAIPSNGPEAEKLSLRDWQDGGRPACEAQSADSMKGGAWMTKDKKTKVHEDRVRRLAARTRKEFASFLDDKNRNRPLHELSGLSAGMLLRLHMQP